MKLKRTIFASIIFFLVSLLFAAGITSCGEDEDSSQLEKQTQEQIEREKQRQLEKQRMEEERERERKRREEEAKKKAEKEKSKAVPDEYIVKDGETLQIIADRFYGDPGMWYEIFAENESRIDYWDNIYPGQKLKMPEPKEKKKK
jgi:nucleoid-associated protein YgaU